MLNPHLFTHLFYEGVICSTRKLVYDSGSNEEAIKALMQAQHKAVMKDLRKGTFDDKIDQYLGGTPGLEPRTTGEPTQIQNIETRMIHPRTFHIDPSGRMLVAQHNLPVLVREGNEVKTVSAGLSVFRIGADGKLGFAPPLV